MYKPAISMSFTFERWFLMFVTSSWLGSLLETRLSESWVPCIWKCRCWMYTRIFYNSPPLCDLFLILFTVPKWIFRCFFISFMYPIINHVACDTSLRQCIIAFVIRPTCARSWTVTIMFSNHHPWILSVPWDRIIIILLCIRISCNDDVWSSFFASWRYYHAVLSYSHDIIPLCFRIFVIDVSLTT